MQMIYSCTYHLTQNLQLAVERIQNCINDIKQWMRANKLKLNDDKTELLILSSKSRKKYINSNSVKIGISDIQTS